MLYLLELDKILKDFNLVVWVFNSYSKSFTVSFHLPSFNKVKPQESRTLTSSMCMTFYTFCVPFWSSLCSTSMILTISLGSKYFILGFWVKKTLEWQEESLSSIRIHIYPFQTPASAATVTAAPILRLSYRHIIIYSYKWSHFGFKFNVAITLILI